MINYQINVNFYFFTRKKIHENKINSLIYNAKPNQIELLNEQQQATNETDLIENIKKIFTSDAPISFYAKKNNALIKVTLNNDPESYIIFTPQEPFCTKKGFDAPEEALDLAPYVKMVLNFCENFAIYEFTTEPITETNLPTD